MTCGIDEILQQTQATLDNTLRELIQNLATDYNVEMDPATVAATPQARELRGALQTFAVWLIHEHKRSQRS
ncbi:MAG: hypothetical protein HQL63_08700 [Magnetococcales bacterium]|nr:hypothetical protein [Magnetococcales bacterium]